MGGGEIHLCPAHEQTPSPISHPPGVPGIVIADPGELKAECRRLREAEVELAQERSEVPGGG